MADKGILPPLDYDSWEIVFAAYQHYPVEALLLGANIMVMKAYLLVELPRLAEVIEGLDRAMEVLFQRSQFRDDDRSTCFLRQTAVFRHL